MRFVNSHRLMHGLSAIALLCAIAGLNPRHAQAQAHAFPAKPITIIVPHPPGVGTDALARVIGPKLSEILRQPIAIDNRPGAGGTLGTAVAARVPADGHHLLILNTLPHTSAAGLLCLRYSPPSGSLLCLASHMNPPKTDQYGSSKPIPKWG